MTRDEVLSMKPGRELDVLVAEKVMGWASLWTDGEYYMMYPPIEQGVGNIETERHPVPYYSSDIAAAWEVADQLQNQGYVVCIELLPYEETSVGIYEADPANQIAYAKAQTPTEAICKTALLAVMEG